MTCIARLATLILWVLSSYVYYSVDQMIENVANQRNGYGEYADDYDPPSEEDKETEEEVNFSLRVLFGFIVVVLTALINVYIIHQVKAQDPNDEGSS